MSPKNSSTPLRTAAIYAAFGIIWILTSDILLELKSQELVLHNHTLLQVAKGSLFVLTSAGLIYLILRRDLKLLRESEKKYRELFENSGTNILIIDANGKYLMVNRHAANVFGLPEHEVIGKSMFDFLPEESAQKYIQRNRELLATGGQREYEDTFQMPTGELTFLIIDRCLQDENGFNYAIQSSSVDITARKEAEEKLRESEDRYRMLYDYSLDAIMLTIPDGQILSANPAACRMFGRSEDELKQLGRVGVADTTDPRLGSALAERAETGRFSGELTFLRNNGEKFPAEISTSIFKDGSGRIKSGIIIRDISERKKFEETLQLQSAMLEASANAIVITNARGMIEWANPAFTLLTGYRVPEEVFGLSPRDLVRSGRQTQEFYKSLWDTILQGNAWHGELVNRRKDGSLYDEEMTITPVKGKTGEIEHFIAIKQNITQRKQAEEALKQAEQKYRNIFENATEGIHQTTHDGRYISVNPATARILGYSSPEELMTSINDLNTQFYVDPNRRKAFIEEMEKYGAVSDFESEVHQKDGNTVWVSENVHSVYSMEGEFLYYEGTSEDITARKKAEQALKESQTKLQAIIDFSPALISIKDLSGNVILANKSFAVLDAPPLNEFIGKNVFDLFPKEVAQKLWDNDLAALRNNAPIRSEEVVKHKDGNWHTYWTVKFPLYLESGRTFGVCAISDDITERKKAEELIQQYAHELENRVAERTMELIHANHTKDEFLANMSHELRTPLTGILGVAEVLLAEYQGPLTEKQARSVEMINSSGQHLLGLINDILDVSKIEAGKFELKPEIISINDLCLASLVFVKQMAAKKSISVEFSPITDQNGIYADPKRLKQILVNLLTNAVKFTPENGTVCLNVLEANHEVSFSVIDSGIGISPENLKKLFHPFVQLDSSLSRQYEGTGLGLILVKRLVELHGGQINVESEVGKGSCFQFSIPNIKSEEALHSVQRKTEVNLQIPQGQGKQILIAEDNPVNMNVMSDFLGENGYILTQARNGIEALDQTRKQKPDLILMDIQMPGVNGLEVIKRLRADQETESIPVIALTALAMPGDRENCLSAGANEYITKPLSLRGLAETIAKLLQLKK